MKSLSKLVALATGTLTLALVAFSLSPVFADSPGQLEGGSFVYEVKNLTQAGALANTISAKACEQLQYRVYLHNTEFGALNNVIASVNLPSTTGTSNTSTMTATTALGGTTGTNGTSTINLTSAQSISYLSGSTKLSDGSGNLISGLPDGITSGGVNIGTLNGSTTEVVTFQANVSCPVPPAAPVVTPAATKLTALPNTGPGDIVELFAGASGLGAAGHFIVNRRRR